MLLGTKWKRAIIIGGLSTTTQQLTRTMIGCCGTFKYTFRDNLSFIDFLWLLKRKHVMMTVIYILWLSSYVYFLDIENVARWACFPMTLQSWKILREFLFFSRGTFRKMEENSFLILLRLTVNTSHRSITAFPKAPISVHYFRFSSFSPENFLTFMCDTQRCSRNEESRKIYVQHVAPHFLFFSFRLPGAFFRTTKTLSVYYLPRTDEVDCSIITRVKRFSNSLTFFYTEDNWVVRCEVFKSSRDFVQYFTDYFFYKKSLFTSTLSSFGWFFSKKRFLSRMYYIIIYLTKNSPKCVIRNWKEKASRYKTKQLFLVVVNSFSFYTFPYEWKNI